MTIPSFQQDAWKRLAGMRERAPHALLLHGPQGVGKLQLAQLFTQLLLCEAPKPRDAPCGTCDGCRWFLAGHHPDVRLVEPETISRQSAAAEGEGPDKPKGKPSAEIKIEQVRALADFVNIGSHRGGRRVAILHPAEAMNPHSANALLKSLEEPPGAAMFLLVSHRPARLLATLRSRCVPVPVLLPEAGAARKWLEAQGVRDAAKRLSFAGGAPLQALADTENKRGALVDEILKMLAARDAGRLQAQRDREGLELLAEVLQKSAYDGVFAAFGLQPKYGTGGPLGGSKRQWLAYARKLGRDRALARHPVNAALHAAEMLAGLPGR